MVFTWRFGGKEVSVELFEGASFAKDMFYFFFFFRLLAGRHSYDGPFIWMDAR